MSRVPKGGQPFNEEQCVVHGILMRLLLEVFSLRLVGGYVFVQILANITGRMAARVATWEDYVGKYEDVPIREACFTIFNCVYDNEIEEHEAKKDKATDQLFETLAKKP